MGTRLAGNFCGGASYVFPGGLACPTGAAGRERVRTEFAIRSLKDLEKVVIHLGLD